jgi:hypothetical protein
VRKSGAEKISMGCVHFSYCSGGEDEREEGRKEGGREGGRGGFLPVFHPFCTTMASALMNSRRGKR